MTDPELCNFADECRMKGDSFTVAGRAGRHSRAPGADGANAAGPRIHSFE
ncbi:hypothetical protein [Kitasatospora purpeofusca]|uniref:Uncharacterized protein n=1 Tax=Kitasatospora purpeofusca TaxID=67352 RepID=A0ABZ1TS73_9ACTN|nr:hypothetical protein [Kitasatospora purpeofusca]